MNELIENFDKLYPAFSTTPLSGTCEIDEQEAPDDGSSFRKLTITGLPTVGALFPHELPGAASSFFDKAGSRTPLTYNCDGIFYTEKDGKRYIFACELKSSFNKASIGKAKEQIIGSCMKLHSLFSLLQGYSADDIEVRGLIVSYLPTTETLTSIKDMQNPIDRFCIRLYADKSYLMPKRKCDRYYAPIRTSDIKIHYIGVPDRHRSHAIDLNLLLGN